VNLCPICGATADANRAVCARCGTTLLPHDLEVTGVQLPTEPESEDDRGDHEEYDVAYHVRELMRDSITRSERRTLAAAGEVTISELLATGETPLGLTSVLYEGRQHLLTVTESRLRCVSDSGELSVDLELDDIDDARIVDDEEVQGISIARHDTPEPFLFDVGDVDWSEYLVGLLLDEEEADREIEEPPPQKFSTLLSPGDAAADPSPAALDLASQLERLAALRRQDLLSADEFAAAKRFLLDGGPQGASSSAP